MAVQLSHICVYIMRTCHSCVESYCLILWPEEDSVSVVSESAVLGSLTVGNNCQVKMGHNKYNGRILAVGMYF